jgi:putative transposase
VLFFIALGSRRFHFAGVTSNPNQTWITQQARQLVWDLHDRERCLQFLIHDNDCSFRKAFDAVFESEGISIIHTPFQAPNANAHAERWVRTVREECLDDILIIKAVHLERVLLEFAQYYNASRPHQGIGQQMPIPYKRSTPTGSIQSRTVLGGIINNYYRSLDSHVPAVLG